MVGHYPFNTSWGAKGRNVLHKKMYSADTDQAFLTVFQNYFFDSTIVTKKWVQYWTGTAWATLDVGYTPLTESHWANPDPTTVSDAIDRIASAVYALRGNVAIP